MTTSLVVGPFARRRRQDQFSCTCCDMTSLLALFVLLALPGLRADTLQLVQILFRHGNRSPLYTFPTDVNTEYWEEIGLGQLSNVGKEEHYELGRYTRDRYRGFLNESYNRDYVVVRSTDVDRTLMSAECNLAGLYPPEETTGQVWNRNFSHWQPIPIHTVDADSDYLLSFPDCPKYDEEVAKVIQSPAVQKILEGEAEFYEFLTEVTGLNCTGMSYASAIYDTLLIEKVMNMSLPSWLNDTVFDRLRYNAYMSFYLTSAYTTVEQRLRSGLLVKEMISNVHGKMNNSNARQQLYVYSAHDTNIVGFLASLGVYNMIAPPFASAVFVELHRLEDESFAIQVSYRNTSASEPYVLTVPGCSSMCPVDMFVDLTEQVIPGDIYEECGIPGRKFPQEKVRAKRSFYSGLT